MNPSGYCIRLVSEIQVCVVVCVAGTVLLRVRAEGPAAAIGACDERVNPGHVVASLRRSIRQVSVWLESRGARVCAPKGRCWQGPEEREPPSCPSVSQGSPALTAFLARGSAFPLER